jgi:YhcH/YjgK/YiaL family protein
VSDYETAPAEEKGWEAHRRYIDVQYIASGTEKMGYAEISALRVVSEYDEDKDIIWLDGDGDFVTAHAGTFVVFFRQDAHKPGVTVENPCSVRKVVVKVLEP